MISILKIGKIVKIDDINHFIIPKNIDYIADYSIHRDYVLNNLKLYNYNILFQEIPEKCRLYMVEEMKINQNIISIYSDYVVDQNIQAFHKNIIYTQDYIFVIYGKKLSKKKLTNL